MEKLYFFDETFYWGRSGKRATVIEVECELKEDVRPEELRQSVLNALRVHRNFRVRPVIVGRRFFAEDYEDLDEDPEDPEDPGYLIARVVGETEEDLTVEIPEEEEAEAVAEVFEELLDEFLEEDD